MDSFEQVRLLDTPALRELFARGRPEQRVWATWALALRTGGIMAIADAASTDPDPGVRRTLAVMLAAHGELDLLVALARHDPEVVVRGSAMQLVTRLAVQGALPEAIVLDAARIDPPVRRDILAVIGRDAPAYLVELATELLREGAPVEQAEAFEALLRTESRELCRAALAWLERLADPRDALVRMVHALGAYAVACELAGASRELRAAALAVVHAPPWAVIEQLVGDDMDLLVTLVRERRVDVPIAALARAALDGHAHLLVAKLSEELATIDTVSDDLRPLLPLLAHHYGEWIAALERDDEALSLPASSADAEYLRERHEARAHLVSLRRQLRRLVR